jgi:EAL domain-containing protein (putative c-di-GMP-specific phosphodiesterase class I)
LTVSELAIGTEEREIGVCFFDDTVEKFIERETYIKRELDEVASSDENAGLYLQFQPIVDIKTRGICGFEALARLRTSNLEQISPVEFIPIAEKTKLIVPIGWKIARLAFLFLKRINNAGFCDISMAINVSAIQLLKRHFIEDLQHLIIETEVNPQDIVIEITESVFVSGFERINKIFDQLRAVGIKVAIDDFGTEYSSLARERELKVDCIKIDKSFIDRLLQVPYEYAITSDIISMAHKLGHCTVAEGVEYKEQEQYLLENGCDKIQGYLISKPLDADAAISFLGSTVIAGIV